MNSSELTGTPSFRSPFPRPAAPPPGPRAESVRGLMSCLHLSGGIVRYHPGIFSLIVAASNRFFVFCFCSVALSDAIRAVSSFSVATSDINRAFSSCSVVIILSPASQTCPGRVRESSASSPRRPRILPQRRPRIPSRNGSGRPRPYRSNRSAALRRSRYP